MCVKCVILYKKSKIAGKQIIISWRIARGGQRMKKKSKYKVKYSSDFTRAQASKYTLFFLFCLKGPSNQPTKLATKSCGHDMRVLI